MGKLRWRDRGAAARADDCGIRTESCLKRADPSNFDHSGGLAKVRLMDTKSTEF